MDVNSESQQGFEGEAALDLTEREGALAAAVLELVRHARSEGADGSRATSRFAFFITDELLSERPELRAVLPEETVAQAAGDPHHLTSIETGTTHSEVGHELSVATWPSGLAGGYVQGLVRGSSEAGPGHVDTSRVFVAVGALLTGETFCAVEPAEGAALRVGRAVVPELVAALSSSLGIEPRDPA
ncbi:MAG: hypothetical protein Q4G21_07065 [Dermabacter sp.]|nr:hypothetical protein [Dermabacter sp.]